MSQKTKDLKKFYTMKRKEEKHDEIVSRKTFNYKDLTPYNAIQRVPLMGEDGILYK